MSNSNRIYLGRLPYGTRERDVERFLKGCGRVREINLKNGFGFVTFDDYRDADDAVADLHDRELLGERIIVEACRGTQRGYSGGQRRFRSKENSSRYGAPTRTPWRVIVENLSTRVSWQDLKDYVRQAGEVTYGDAHRPVKGEGVLEFASYDDVKSVIRKLDGSNLNGRKIRLIKDCPKDKRSRSRSRSRSSSRSRRRRSRSRSRSKSRSRSRSRSARSRSHGSRASRSRSKSKSRSRSRSGSANDRDRDTEQRQQKEGSDNGDED